MQPTRKHITRFITLLLALQLLNLSIYAQDFRPIYTAAGSDEMNITETVSEYIVEVVLGHTNAIPEQSQHHKDLHFHKHFSFKAVSAFPVFQLPGLQACYTDLPVPLHQSYSYLYLQEINPPPPKA